MKYKSLKAVRSACGKQFPTRADEAPIYYKFPVDGNGQGIPIPIREDHANWLIANASDFVREVKVESTESVVDKAPTLNLVPDSQLTDDDNKVDDALPFKVDGNGNVTIKPVEDNDG